MVSLTLNCSTLQGNSYVVEAAREWTGYMVKEVLEPLLEMPARDLRLLHQAVEVSDESGLDILPKEEVVDLTVFLRTSLLSEWLEKIAEEGEAAVDAAPMQLRKDKEFTVDRLPKSITKAMPRELHWEHKRPPRERVIWGGTLHAICKRDVFTMRRGRFDSTESIPVERRGSITKIHVA